jgi:hypothetical protein
MSVPERDPFFRFSWRSGAVSDIALVKRDIVSCANGGGAHAPVLK